MPGESRRDAEREAVARAIQTATPPDMLGLSREERARIADAAIAALDAERARDADRETEEALTRWWDTKP